MSNKEKRKYFLRGAVTAVLVVAGALLVFILIAMRQAPARPDSISALAKIAWVQNTIRQKYMGEIDEQAQVDDMILGLVAGLGDPYSTYYTAEEYQAISTAHKGQMEGIGVVLMQDLTSGDLLITEIIEDSPAEEAGLQAGDIVLEINGNDASARPSSEAAAMIDAVTEGPVIFKVRRGEEEHSFSMEKRPINIRSARGKMLEDKIGYIEISSFNDLTPVQFQEAYAELTDQGMTSLIIDLRENLGGLVDACCDTLRQILPAGVIVYEEDNRGKLSTRECDGETPIEIPLVLLVNRNTASSSEIFTGAVQDYGVGTVMGETTLGKGIEQNFFKLPDGSVVKLTTTHYVTPNKRDLHLQGLEPDIDLTDVELSATEDTWLAAAIEELKKS